MLNCYRVFVSRSILFHQEARTNLPKPSSLAFFIVLVLLSYLKSCVLLISIIFLIFYFPFNPRLYISLQQPVNLRYITTVLI